MICKTFFRRGIIFPLLLFFLHSCQKKEICWNYSEVLAKYPMYDTARLVQPKAQFNNSLKAEFVSGSGGLRTYFIITSCPLLADCDQTVGVRYRINEEEFFTRGYLLAGGQKILLQPEDSRRIIGALLQNNCIDVAIGDYRCKLEPLDFCLAYEKLTNIL